MKIFSLVFFCLLTLTMKAQNVSQKLTFFLYNYDGEKYDSIYNDLNDEGKQKISLSSFSAFLQNVKNGFGKSKTSEKESESASSGKYKIVCEKSVFVLSIFIDGNNKISGLQIVPYTEVKNVVRNIQSSNTMQSKTDSIADIAAHKYFDESNAVGLIIGISINGKRTYYGYGQLKLDAETIPDSLSIFEIGSLTKTFTSSLLAQAVMEKKINLDDPVKKYLPSQLELNKDGKDITFRELANHTSGLPRMMDNFETVPGYNSSDPYKNYTSADMLSYLSNNVVVTTPGTVYEYSNLGAGLLGLALENIYKKSYPQLLDEFFFLPLKMSESFINVPENLNAVFADGHNEKGIKVPHWNFDCMAPAGSIKSSAHDILNFLEAQLNDKNETFSLTHHPTFKISEQLSIGLGWHILNDVTGQNKIIWHNGETGGFSSFAGFNEDKKTAIIVMANNNISTAVDDLAVNILKQLLQ
jgi:CubicO group peptidase (beta-lactamase class C family)